MCTPCKQFSFSMFQTGICRIAIARDSFIRVDIKYGLRKGSKLQKPFDDMLEQFYNQT